MKTKKIAFVVVTCIVSVFSSINIYQNKENKASDITIGNIEAIAACEVSSDSSNNTGNCVKDMEGTKDVCVKATVWWAVDCSGNI